MKYLCLQQMNLSEHTCTGRAIGFAALFLCGRFNLVNDGLWVNTAAIEVALVRKQVLRVVLAKRVRRGR